MEDKLIIVESPTKARTIYGYLQGRYSVLASRGHVKDLPEKEFGVDITKGFKPKYVVIKGKFKTLQEIKKASKTAKQVFLASDPDREGEAIAYHIAQEIRKVSKNNEIKRILLYEITRDSLFTALNEPTDIDINKVYAQLARRILDRIVGYKVSPLLWKVMYRGLSAGRVQTVALRLVVEREREIENFVPETYWLLYAELKKDGTKFRAIIGKLDGKDIKKFSKKEDAEKVLERLKGKEFKVISVDTKEIKSSPMPPYKTSTLQQDANIKLGFSAKRTMSLAQQLYEGVEIQGIGTKGLITYMRTDSVRISDKAIGPLRRAVKDTFGEQYLSRSKRLYADKKSGVQGAHECIRPTDPSLNPESLRGRISEDLRKLYELIWRRALASQAKDAVFKKTSIRFKADGTEWLAEGRLLVFDGFYKITGDTPKATPIPSLKMGEKLLPLRIIMQEKKTEPPRRYTEATLVRELEAKGIGRPSTYAPTISTLKGRKYITNRGRYLVPTELGKTVTDILIPRFKEIFDYSFTAKMEKELDRIETGESSWQEVLEEFYREFEKELSEVERKLPEISESLQDKTDESCPECGAPLVIKWGKYGKFVACSRFPECKYTREIEEEIREDVQCPICEKPMKVRHGPHGRYLACIDYPKCKGTRPYHIGVDCPECGSPLVEKTGKKKRLFYVCTSKECDFIVFNLPVQKECPKCGYSVMVKVSSRRGKELECPKCKTRIKDELTA